MWDIIDRLSEIILSIMCRIMQLFVVIIGLGSGVLILLLIVKFLLKIIS